MATPEFFLALVILSLAVAGVAHLLVHERGPFGLLAGLRRFVGARQVQVTRETFNQVYSTSECEGSNELARILCCTVCASTWLSLLAVIAWDVLTVRNLPLFDFLVCWFTVFQMSRILQRWATF